MRTLVLLLLLSALHVCGAEWFVAPEGAQGNDGTKDHPWDLESALNGGHSVAPGDSICLTAGTYKRRPKELFEVKLSGSEEKPVVVRPAEYGGRVIVDGGLTVQAGTANLWIRDLEILVSEPQPEEPVGPGSHPEGFTRPWGGVTMSGGKNCKYINLVIHDTRQAMSCWTPETDCEIYGCILYDNGWKATDRGHGHCIYTQNKDGVKTIRHCIMSARFDGAYTLHAYGSSKAFISNYLIEENIFHERGPVLIGGGSPSAGIRVFRNYLNGVGMKLGYGAENLDCEVRDNYIAGGGLSIDKFEKIVNENNTIIGKDDKTPAEAKIVLLKNKYDDSRAYLAIYNWTGAKEVKVEVGTFVKDGESCELRDSQKAFEAPVQTLKAEGGAVKVPVSEKFHVFILTNAGTKRPY